MEDKVHPYETFLTIENYSKLVVDETIAKAIKYIKESTDRVINNKLSKYDTEIFQNIEWPTIDEFTTNLGLEKINEFIANWLRKPEWLYCMDFISRNSDPCSDYYFYEVKWSIPTYAYPIPQVIASVFFTIEVSKIKPVSYPVEVTYVLEGTHFVHTPGETNFQEKWLMDIIESKLRFFKTIKF